MNIGQIRTHGYFSHEFLAFASAVLTANSPATGTDGVYQEGIKIDRFSLQSLFLSAKVIMPLTIAGLDSGNEVAIQVKVQDCDTENGTYVDVDTIDAVSYAADGSFVQSHNINLAGYRRWVRLMIQGTFDAAATDTADVAAILQVGGHDELPVTVTP